MADVMPDYGVEMQRLVAQIANLRSTYERQKLENMQLKSRIASNTENMESTTGGIKELETKLRDLEKTHGPVEEGL